MIICPFCFEKSDELLPTGISSKLFFEKEIVGGGRRNVLCPTCGSSDRDRLVYIYLFDIFGIFSLEKEIKILHIAPERLVYGMLARIDNVSYVCGDLFPENYQKIQKIDLQDMIFEEETFDLIICNHVLEHVKDDHRAMKEIFRVMKKGAKAILQVPISVVLDQTYEDKTIQSEHERESAYGQSDHMRLYGKDYPDRLRNAGFEVSKLRLYPEYSRFGINPKEELIIGSK